MAEQDLSTPAKEGKIVGSLASTASRPSPFFYYPVFPVEHWFKELDRCLGMLALLMEYVKLLSEAGKDDVIGLEDGLDMLYTRMTHAMCGLQDARSKEQDEAGKEIKYVPLYSMQEAEEVFNSLKTPSADHAQTENKGQSMPIPKSYYRDGLYTVEANSNNMAPTIKMGAILGLSPFVGYFTEGAMYLVKFKYVPVTAMIMRAYPLTDKILLKHDNPDNEPIELSHEEYELDAIILGRVAWIWQWE